MKIYVNEMPTESKKCLFSSKEKYLNAYTSDGERVNLYTYYCNINGRECDLQRKCGHCRKLMVMK